jgi:hypothetical protein
VYRAHDSRLDRDVAIKASKAQFTERFTRDRGTQPHQHLPSIYDVGPEYDVGPDCLVMEYHRAQVARSFTTSATLGTAGLEGE